MRRRSKRSRACCASPPAQLQLEFAAAGRVDYTYVAGAAREALVGGGAADRPGAARRAALRHILVDEFQDTSLAQFDLLEALTAGWEPGDGRTLFAVGDPMQSIYQFRDAEVGLFLRARDSGIGNVPLESLQLTRNFRSSPRSSSGSNDTFAQLSRARRRARQRGGLHAEPRLRASTGAAPALSLSLFGRRRSRRPRRAPSRERIARDSRRRRRPTRRSRCSSSRARTRRRSWRRSRPLRYRRHRRRSRAAAGSLDRARSRRAAAALHHLGDRTAWLTVLRAPWCGVSLPTLTAAFPAAGSALLSGKRWSTHERLARCDADGSRAARAHSRGADAGARIARSDAACANGSRRCGCGSAAPDAYAREDLLHARAFFAALGECAARGEWRGPQDIDALVAELFAEPRAAPPNPVQVMTIHRAKGLEFDHVFLPRLDRS